MAFVYAGHGHWRSVAERERGSVRLLFHHHPQSAINLSRSVRRQHIEVQLTGDRGREEATKQSAVCLGGWSRFQLCLVLVLWLFHLSRRGRSYMSVGRRCVVCRVDAPLGKRELWTVVSIRRRELLILNLAEYRGSNRNNTQHKF